MTVVVVCRFLLTSKLLLHSTLPLPALILLVQILDGIEPDQSSAMQKTNRSQIVLLEVTSMLAEVHCQNRMQSPYALPCPALPCPAVRQASGLR